MKLEGQAFTNSDTCHGVSFVGDASPVDLAEIVIDGRYPETGWARNLESHEIARVVRGAGRLAVRDSETITLEPGDVVNVPAGQWFAWSGDMTLLMACSPPFNPDQYETREN